MADGERRVMVLIEILSKPVAVRVAPASLCKVRLTSLSRIACLAKTFLKVMTLWQNRVRPSNFRQYPLLHFVAPDSC